MDYTRLSREQLITYLEERDENERGGIRLTYKGQTPPWRIVRRVRPRRQKIEAELCIGDEAEQDCNLLVEGENLQAMVSLYKYRGQVDLVLTDPPYNTGRDFRYNDKWDEDPNDPDLGKFVAEEDGSKHSKWLRFMEPRIWIIREMLRPSGVLAICIDQRELFRLGLLLDGIFGQENRLAVINWQKSYSPRNDRGHASTATEYVLVYAKNEGQSLTSALPRTAEMDARYSSRDGDPHAWKPGDLTAPGSITHKGMIYAIQSPFTGELHYPTPGRHWGSERKNLKKWLAAWGSRYIERDLGDGNPPAFVIKGAPLPGERDFCPQNAVLSSSREEATRIRDAGCWPSAHWRDGGQGTFGMKKYLENVRQGKVPTTYWADDDYESPLALGSTSWSHKESGHSQIGIRELDAIVGRGHGFDTVKPQKLFTKLIQIWCPPNGVVMDPFAGSGTTAHAVLELNHESGGARRFVLVEQGRPNKRDDYARTLTAVRVTRAITGERVAKDGTVAKLAVPLPGGFRFSRLSHLVDSDAVLALEREEMIDLLITSHWDQGDRSSTFLHRLPAGTERHLFGVDGSRRGYFLIWEGPGGQNRLNRTVFREIVGEARQHELSPPYHVYARLNTYDGPNVEFYQIPDRILEKLGVNTSVEPFNADIEQGKRRVSAIQQLRKFQQIAANTIAERFGGLLSDPNAPTMTRQWEIFFYQALSALTGSGKTPILADAVAQMRAHLSGEPLVLWVSKHRVVVDQTLANFQAGGKYENLVEGFLVGRLSELRAEGLDDALTPRLLLATTGTFNQKDKGAGTLRVHNKADDTLPGPLWEALRGRRVKGKRRPLIIVYDEGHNLTDQQTDLLLELEPEALLVASATLRTAPKLMRMIERLRDHGWHDDNLITSVKSSDVVTAGLVKSHVALGGFETSMELTLEPMIQAFRALEEKAAGFGAPFRPKAIYVCQTNKSQDDGAMDNHAKPFVERRAAPILIWRYLTETAGIDPSEIAVYCDLKFDKKYPRPDEFELFSGGEDDYALFTEGNYRHIIFNLTLQEGWDDPECCFAYIDKSMGSNVQIEQVIGRVLRQPGAQHYTDDDLNTAEFFVRMDDRQTFTDILKLVQAKLASEAPETKLTTYVGKGGRATTRLEPKEVRTLPSVHVDSEDAIEPIAEAIAALRDYHKDDIYTVGEGRHLRALQAIGTGAAALVEEHTTEHSNPVLARFVLRRALQAQHPKAANVINWADPKFDARIEINSLAAQELRDAADKLVGLYFDHTRLVCESANPHEVGPVLVRPEKFVPFTNALHDGYSDLNSPEEDVAYALDKTGHVWARNPSPSGFSIPLLDRGRTQNFYPDFLVWKNDTVFAIDPKGEPYLATDAGRKLLSIRDESGKKVAIVRLITSGRWNSETLKQISDDGYTAWTLTNTGKIRSRHKDSVTDIVDVCLDDRF